MEITYREAIVAAQREALKNDDRVMVMGEDIGVSGGPFKTTVGLFEEFGGARVRDTPICEEAFVGAAMGMAVTGRRPIVELMFADFMGVCFDQIVNGIAKHRFMCGGKVMVPLVIRTMGGGGTRFGAQHSQTGETWVSQFPGLKVVCAADPSDAYNMLRWAIKEDNPVIVLEHKFLFTRTQDVDLDAPISADILTPAVLRQGNDVTIVATLAMVERALAAAETLAAKGINVEVINLRCLRPLNMEPILESVRKTNRLLCVEENHSTGGWGGEVAARTTSEAFDYLDAPPERLTLPDWPMPYSPELEDAAMPSADKVVETVVAMLT
ncbi:MAG: alpha-ketoacid dehydrogenase subunit beta [Alphaproteobacteria bacterium]|nr:MAG: alpha-ketoacid dehydrogenase subunit beta [Alphaproteobacteria bacterium]